MDNQLHKPADSMTAAGTLAMVPHSGSVFTLVIVALLALLISTSAVLGWKIYDLQASPSKAHTNAPSNTAPIVNQTATEAIQEHFMLDYTPSTGSSGQSKHATITLRVPSVLRTQITNTLCQNGYQGGPSTGLLSECLRLSFADTLGSVSSLENGGQLEVWDAYNWLPANENPEVPFATFGLSSTTEKQTAWRVLTTLTPTTNLTSVFQKLPQQAVDATYIGGPQHLTYTATSDGALRGVAFVATIGQAAAYDPAAWFELGGTVGGQPILITGSCKASDPTVLQIQQLEAQGSNSAQASADQITENAIRSFSTGMLSPQTSSAFNQVITMLQSISLSVS